MTTRPPLAVMLLTVVGVSVLYAPQPLLPGLAVHFGIGPGEASLVITLTTLPLADAPLLYGEVREGLAVCSMLVMSTLMLLLAAWSLRRLCQQISAVA